MPKSSKSYSKLQAQKKRAREKDYRKKLKLLKETGLYAPKSSELTKDRKTRINRIYKENAKQLDKREFHFVRGLTNKRENKKALALAKQLKYQTTRTGFFIEREGERKARLVKSRSKRGEYEIHLTGKIRRGSKAGKKSDQYIPLTSIDKLTLEEDRLDRMAKSFGPLRGNQRLAFKVTEIDKYGEKVFGYSHQIFDNIDELKAYLKRYQKSTMAMLNFLRIMTIEKTTVGTWFKQHPVKPRKRNRRIRKERFPK